MSGVRRRRWHPGRIPNAMVLGASTRPGSRPSHGVLSPGRLRIMVTCECRYLADRPLACRGARSRAARPPDRPNCPFVASRVPSRCRPRCSGALPACAPTARARPPPWSSVSGVGPSEGSGTARWSLEGLRQLCHRLLGKRGTSESGPVCHVALHRRRRPGLSRALGGLDDQLRFFQCLGRRFRWAMATITISVGPSR